jgi:hypothetical protein
MRVGWFGISDLMDGKEQGKRKKEREDPNQDFLLIY